MKPSSSPSEVQATPSGLFDGIFARGEAARALGDAAWLRAILDFEAALARALLEAKLVPAKAAEAVQTAARADDFDMVDIARAAAASGNPIPAVVKELTKRLPAEATTALHMGATSQDVIDTAMMLLAKRAGGLVLSDLATATDRCAELARQHRESVMLGRTLLQPALPITFGMKAASWLNGLLEASDRLASCVRHQLFVQFGGAAGTLAALGTRGVEVGSLLAKELDLAEPTLPWHTIRTPLLRVATAFAEIAAVLDKIARDVTLLAQFEIGEVREKPSADRGGSSTMPQKQNPVAAVCVLGCTRRVPGLLSTLFAVPHELDRAAGGWHAEWQTLTELMRLVASATAWGASLLLDLEVDAAKMKANLDRSGELLLSEHLAVLLVPALGRGRAQELVRRAALQAKSSERSLVELLFDEEDYRSALAEAGLDRNRVERALEPNSYLGSAQTWVERALASYADSLTTRRRQP